MLNWAKISAPEATLAQLVERLIRNQQVASSILAGGSSIFNHIQPMVFGAFPGFIDDLPICQGVFVSAQFMALVVRDVMTG